MTFAYGGGIGNGAAKWAYFAASAPIWVVWCSAAVEAFKAWTEGKGRRPARKMWPDYVLSPKLNGVSERLDDEGGGAACGVRQGVPSAEDGGDGGRLSQFSCFVQVLPGARNGVLREGGGVITTFYKKW